MAEKTPVASQKNGNPLTLATADPAPLGLIGLAVAALVLASTDLGFASSSAKSLMIPWTLFLGATAQLIAGIIEYRRNNIFGATAFTTYSLLWYSISLTLFFTIFTGVTFDIFHYAFGLIGFFIFSMILTIASLLVNKTFLVILTLIDLAIFALVMQILFKTSAFYVGFFLILVSISSFYGAAAVLLNTTSGRSLLPLGKAIWGPKQQK
jgi:hypothetical protein